MNEIIQWIPSIVLASFIAGIFVGFACTDRTKTTPDICCTIVDAKGHIIFCGSEEIGDRVLSALREANSGRDYAFTVYRGFSR